MPPGVPSLVFTFKSILELIIMKKNVIRLLFALVALLTSTSMLAENKLWIASEGNGSFAIMMNCDENAAAMQFNLQLPEELSSRQVNWEGK